MAMSTTVDIVIKPSRKERSDVGKKHVKHAVIRKPRSDKGKTHLVNKERSDKGKKHVVLKERSDKGKKHKSYRVNNEKIVDTLTGVLKLRGMGDETISTMTITDIRQLLSKSLE